jgi:hypothetical protein
VFGGFRCKKSHDENAAEEIRKLIIFRATSRYVPEVPFFVFAEVTLLRFAAQFKRNSR